MTSDPTTSVAPSPKPLSEVKTSRKPKRKAMSQERFMVMFTLFFAIGVMLLLVFPEGSLLRGISMGVYSIAVFWAMFRFGM